MEDIAVQAVEVNTPLGQDVKLNEKTDESEVKISPLSAENGKSPDLFKKPQLLIGPRRGKTVGKVRSVEKFQEQSTEVDKIDTIVDLDVNASDDVETDSCKSKISENKLLNTTSPAQKITEKSIPLPYKEPKWGGLPNEPYSFEVLKCGKILENISLNDKSFFVFGRLSTCDIQMAHPTVSRYHAVVQFRAQSESEPKGFYVYDLGSTHGTFLNKNRIKSNMYVRVQVGHILKLGLSTRLFLLQGPEEDMEEESELTVTQLKEKRQQELALKELSELQVKQEEEDKKKREEEQGIDWGLGEDADEETDLSENPFAATQNEELYINDPKKTLRGWFEQEGHELEYDVEEKGYGQFLCRIELPIENARGGTMIAESLVKGKKKESVVQCALEACRILDRYGLLRQATHESKKRKAKDWEAEDFYDSDEDVFLDRTGTVEKKRQQRMRAAGRKDPDDVVETYDSLMKKHEDILLQLQEVEIKLQQAMKSINTSSAKQEDDDEDALDAFMMKLSMPVNDKKLVNSLKSQLAVLKQEEIRLRKLVNITKPANLPELCPPEQNKSVASSSETSKKTFPIVGRKPGSKTKTHDTETVTETSKPNIVLEQNECEEEEDDEEEKEEISTVEENTKPTTIESEKEKTEVQNDDPLNAVEPKKMKEKTKIFGPAMLPPALKSESASYVDNGHTSHSSACDEEDKEVQKKKNRNKRRIQQRNEKAARQKSDYNPSDPDYSAWLPPEGQTGDGRTKLNEKYGY